MTSKASIMLVCATALALVLGSTAAAQSAAPEAKQEGDKIVLENEHITVWFQGKKPMLKVFPEGNESAGYGYFFTDVIEYRDLNGDGAPSSEEVVARLNLVKASEWEVEHIETDAETILNLTLTAPVRVAGGVLADQDVTLPEQEASVSLVFVLRTQDSTVEAHGVNVTVPRTSIKYDFLVHQWPFMDAEANRLALDMLVQGEIEVQDVAEIGAAAVEANGTAVGALSWTTTATGVLEDGTEIDVPVKTHLRATENATRMVFTYDAAGIVSLVHDPTIGVLAASLFDTTGGEAGALSDLKNTVPAPALPLALVGVAAAGLILRRVRQE